jgi:hypothetical protein
MSPQSEESIGEENNRDKRDTDESIEEEEKGGEDNICVTNEEEDGAVTVLKLSNGVMFRAPNQYPSFSLLLFVCLYTWSSVSATNLVVFCRASTGP